MEFDRTDFLAAHQRLGDLRADGLGEFLGHGGTFAQPVRFGQRQAGDGAARSTPRAATANLSPRRRCALLRGVRHLTLGLLFTVVSFVATARAALSPSAIPDPRPGGWVVDQAHLLAAEDVATINRLGDAVRAGGGTAGFFVVTLPTTDGANHRQFAKQLINRWGPNRSLRSGVLVLLAVGDRKAELVLGDDHLNAAGQAKSDAIMRDEIVAHMKQGDARGALLGSARACAAQFFGVTVAADGTVTHTPGFSAPVAAGPSVADTPLERPATAAAPARTPAPLPPRRAAEEHPTLSLVVGSLLVLLPFTAFAGFVWFIVRRIRAPRRCRRCAREMQKLDQAAEAPYLTPTEQTEERLRTVDYHVWLCGGCGSVDKIRHGRWFTRYSTCPACRAVTRSKVSRTVNSATRHSTGLAEITEHCESCGFHLVTMQTLAMLSDTDSSSSSWSSSSSSSDSGSSSSGGGSSGSW